MELIRPIAVATAILTLIEDAKIKLIIVSPYNNFQYWNKYIKHFQHAHERKVNIKYYARLDAEHVGLDSINITPFLVPNLHAKLYINEKYAIYSSMNLIKYSDDYSIDFAFKTQNNDEYLAAIDFFKTYIEPKAISPSSYSRQVERRQEQLPDIPVSRYFKDDIYKEKHVNFNLRMFPNTSMIAEMSFVRNGINVGEHLIFNADGFLTRIITSEKGNTSFDISYTNSTSLYFLLLSVANCIKGLYGSDVRAFYFGSRLSDFTGNNNEKLLRYIEKILEIGSLDGAESIDDLMKSINRHLLRKVPADGK